MRVRLMSLVTLAAIAVVAGLFLFSHTATAPERSTGAAAAPIGIPLPDARSRVTKKPFGIFVAPQHSPVQPERFTGYHTGADFELAPGEDPHTMLVRVICTGLLREARSASGYGGVAVQSCTLENGPVTVVYGHIRLTSVSAKTGTVLQRGDVLATLGAAYSSETDGERAHLHLGIHRGTAIDIRGYVPTQAELTGWIDPLTVITP